MQLGVSRLLFLGASVVCSTACAKPIFHSNNDTEYPPKSADCDLRVVGSHPGPGYEEIGTVTIEGDRSYGAGSFQDGEEFVDQVRPDLCAAGADVVITEVNGAGIVARGVVLRQVSSGSSVAESECAPICSPGFACSAGTCVPQCNPACSATEACGMDRLCHPLTTEVGAAP